MMSFFKKPACDMQRLVTSWTSPRPIEFTDFSISDNGKFLLSAAKKERSLLIFDAFTGQYIQAIPYPQNGDAPTSHAHQVGWTRIQGVLSVWVFTSESLHIYSTTLESIEGFACSDQYGQFKIHLETSLTVSSIKPDFIHSKYPLLIISISPNGKLLTIVSMDQIIFFNLQTNTIIKELRLSFTLLRSGKPVVEYNPAKEKTVYITQAFFTGDNNFILGCSNQENFHFQIDKIFQQKNITIHLKENSSKLGCNLNQNQTIGFSHINSGAVKQKEITVKDELRRNSAWCHFESDEYYLPQTYSKRNISVWYEYEKNNLYKLDFIASPVIKKCIQITYNTESDGLYCDQRQFCLSPIRGKNISRFLPMMERYQITCIHISPCGQYLVFTNNEGFLVLLDINGINPLVQFQAHNTPIKKVFFTDDRCFSSIAMNEKGLLEIRKWNMTQIFPLSKPVQERPLERSGLRPHSTAQLSSAFAAASITSASAAAAFVPSAPLPGPPSYAACIQPSSASAAVAFVPSAPLPGPPSYAACIQQSSVMPITANNLPNFD